MIGLAQLLVLMPGVHAAAKQLSLDESLSKVGISTSLDICPCNVSSGFGHSLDFCPNLSASTSPLPLTQRSDNFPIVTVFKDICPVLPPTIGPRGSSGSSTGKSHHKPRALPTPTDGDWKTPIPRETINLYEFAIMLNALMKVMRKFREEGKISKAAWDGKPFISVDEADFKRLKLYDLVSIHPDLTGERRRRFEEAARYAEELRRRIEEAEEKKVAEEKKAVEKKKGAEAKGECCLNKEEEEEKAFVNGRWVPVTRSYREQRPEGENLEDRGGYVEGVAMWEYWAILGLALLIFGGWLGVMWDGTWPWAFEYGVRGEDNGVTE